MAGGIHPPLKVIASWPKPDYANAEPRTSIVPVVVIFMILSISMVSARIYVRGFMQRNMGIDDWLILVAMPPTIAMSVLCCLSPFEPFYFGRHIWDVPPANYVKERELVFAIEILYMVSSTLIKISILLFFKRLSPATFTKTYIRVLWGCIAFVAAYGIAFTFLQIFNCTPVNAFWDQLSIEWIANPRQYSCTDEGAGVFATSVISVVEDFIAALLPTWLFWSLKIPIRQKIALAVVFLTGFVTCIFGIMRAYFVTKVFWTTYDVSYYAYDAWLFVSLECLLGCMCASAPPLKIFFRKMLQVRDRTRSRDTGDESLEHIAGQDSMAQSRQRRSWVPAWPKRASAYRQGRKSPNAGPTTDTFYLPREQGGNEKAPTSIVKMDHKQKTSWYCGEGEHESESSCPSF